MKHANDNGKPITFISMFSGIEAASVAFGPLGWKALAFAEIEKFPSAVLAHHYPDVPNVGDMTQHDWSQYHGKVDVVCGGPPCQAFSVAGLRNSMQDARGNLSLSYMKALHAISPRNAIVENVPGWLNTKDNAFGCFLAGLVGADDALPPPSGTKWPSAGLVSGPKGRAAWCILNAQHFGLAQRRKRVIVVADFGNGADPVEVLFERKSLSGYSPASREARKDVAPTISARPSGGGGLGADFDLDGGLVESAYSIQAGALRTNPNSGPDGVGVQSGVAYTLEARAEVQAVYAPEIARCVATREGSSQDYETTTMVAVGVTGETSHSLTAEGADASEDGTGRGTPVIAFSAKDYGADATEELSPTLRAGGHTGSHANAGVMPAIAQSVAIRGREGGATAELGGEVATALRASQGGGDKPHVLVDGLPETAGTMKACAQSGGFSNSADHAAAGYMVPVTTSAVRRLTPVECERLQGFPDNYTQIPWRNKPADQCPDGPRYKALGNSWAVPKFTWLGRRLQAALARRDTTTTTSEAA